MSFTEKFKRGWLPENQPLLALMRFNIIQLVLGLIEQAISIISQDNTFHKREFYYPYGGNRGTAFSALTTKRFTGQYHESGFPGGEGLSYYNARWYDPQLGRFVSADTIVPDPGNPQDLNRMAYVRNNPLLWIDPSGHRLEIGGGPLWPAQYVFGNGVGQISSRPAPQGVKIGEQVEAQTNREFFVSMPVYTAASTFAPGTVDPSKIGSLGIQGVDIENLSGVDGIIGIPSPNPINLMNPR